MENLNEKLKGLKSDIAELKELFKNEEFKLARIENMERAISEYESAEDLEENPEERAEEFDTPEEKIEPKTAEKEPKGETDAEFRKAVETFNQSGK